MAPCFVKPIYHFGLLNQWDVEKSRLSTAARGEYHPLVQVGAERSSEAGIDQNISHTLSTGVTGPFYARVFIYKNTLNANASAPVSRLLL